MEACVAAHTATEQTHRFPPNTAHHKSAMRAHLRKQMQAEAKMRQRMGLDVAPVAERAAG
eukprot:gene11956-15310_t